MSNIRGCDECGGCPRCESEDERGECEGCGEITAIITRNNGEDLCSPCWERVLNLWSEMADEDRHTRGAEGGWCDL